MPLPHGRNPLSPVQSLLLVSQSPGTRKFLASLLSRARQHEGLCADSLAATYNNTHQKKSTHFIPRWPHVAHSELCAPAGAALLLELIPAGPPSLSCYFLTSSSTVVVFSPYHSNSQKLCYSRIGCAEGGACSSWDTELPQAGNSCGRDRCQAPCVSLQQRSLPWEFTAKFRTPVPSPGTVPTLTPVSCQQQNQHLPATAPGTYSVSNSVNQNPSWRRCTGHSQALELMPPQMF